ncbi:xanthine dehydrogenase family protein molybdopterin-binding subunit [Rhodocytophaga rosea]|uniref:Xanthine dehydrogenase family protein molybdopterin-binding subunit n=1 Tax=Rhodocytophaga rosea TaxID=2704465 RepID=A0A6C0GUD5_9BACT|nr:xanthine dehydrogenase family protein molybdopterin-binding subunit [Rhodocytophaga rosea]QHT70970.1 xanthine dehydrogenase family protein molybdopterin-binding subunit [Rhodocytophaga rosea]
MVNNNTTAINRRSFIKVSSLSGVALTLGFAWPVAGKERQAVLQRIDKDTPSSKELNPFVIIEGTGKITLMLHKPEMGQGTYQSMPVILAEELEVRLDQVEIKMAKADKKYGDMGVGGSNSVKGSWMLLRQVGAAAREMLIAAAAQTWNIPAAECYAKEGKVYTKTGSKSLTYGELVEKASKLEAPKEPRLKDPKNFKLIGKAVPRPDILNKVDGTAQFGIDVKVPGMLYASIERAPVFHAKVKNLDDTAAKAVQGVKQVLPSERKLNKNTFHGVAVLADNYWAAVQGRKVLKIEWDNADFNQVNTGSLYKKFNDLAKGEGHISHQAGDFDKTFAEASKKVEAIYELPFAAHAPMEPQNTVAYVQGDKCEIWSPTQVPDWALGEVAAYLKIPAENITLNITFIGGGFGRRLFFDSIMEAVHLSKQANAPVKVVWTREDDMTQGPFRPGTLSSLKAGLDASGKPMAFQHKVVAPSIGYDNFGSKDPQRKEDEGAMEGIKDSAYEIPNIKYNNIYAETTMPLGWWRAVYSTTTAFAHESFIDEMAHAVGKDPVAFRLGMIGKNTRMKNLLTFMAEKSNWNKTMPKGWGKGVAIWQFFAGQAGHVVFVSNTNGKLKIEKIVACIDCGTAVNPDNVKAQVEGATVMALMAALKDQITFENGKAVQSNFHNYRMMRINEIPPVEVHILPSTDKPDGVGEPGLPPLAPALGNAVFAATGKRIRKLPFNLEEV